MLAAYRMPLKETSLLIPSLGPCLQRRESRLGFRWKTGFTTVLHAS
jgi:hypothetical protein